MEGKYTLSNGDLKPEVAKKIVDDILEKCRKRSEQMIALKDAKKQPVRTRPYCNYHNCNYEVCCRFCTPLRFKELFPSEAKKLKQQLKRRIAVKHFFERQQQVAPIELNDVPVFNRFEKLSHKKVTLMEPSNYIWRKVKCTPKVHIKKLKKPHIVVTDFDAPTYWICPSWIKDAHYRLNWNYEPKEVTNNLLEFKNQSMQDGLFEIICTAVNKQFQSTIERDQIAQLYILILDNFNPPTTLLRFNFPGFSQEMQQKLNTISFEIIREFYLTPPETPESIFDSIKEKYDLFMQRIDEIAPKFKEQYAKFVQFFENFNQNVKENVSDFCDDVKKKVKDFYQNNVKKFFETREAIVSFNKDTENVEIKTTVVESLKDKFFQKFLNASTFLQNLPTPTIDEFYELMGTLKPINLANLIGMLAAAKNGSEVLAIMTALSELYGFFWNDELLLMQDLLLQIMAWIASGILACMWNTDRSAQGFRNQGLVTIEDNSCVKDLFAKFSIPFPDNFDDLSLKVIAAVLTGFLLITGGKICSISNLTFKKLEKRVKNLSTDVKSLNNLVEGLPKLWNFAMNEIASLFGFTFESTMTKEVKDFKEELLAFKQEVTSLAELMKMQPQTLLMDSAKLDSAKNSLNHLDKLYADLLKQKENMAATKTIFDDIKNQMKVITNFVDNLKINTCTKIEPFVLVLDGLPEVGKSTFIKYFVKKFALKLHEELPETIHLSPTTYVRNCADKYWSGYAGQMFVIYDDFSQMKEDEDHKDIMNYKNPNKTILNMADLAEKGTLFSSLGVVICTNQGQVASSATVKCTPALNRRFEINILVSDPNLDAFKKKYGKTPGDYEKSNATKENPDGTKGLKAMWTDLEGNTVPYYDKNFKHLTFFMRDKDPLSDKVTEVNANDIINEAFSFFTKYRNDYMEDTLPKTTAEEFNDADSDVSVSSTRSKDTYENAKKRAQKIALDEKTLEVRNTNLRKTIEKEVINTLPSNERIKYVMNAMDNVQKIRSARKNGQRAKYAKVDDIFESSDDIFENQGIEAQSTSKAFVNTTMTKGKIFCVYGDPGTGKSTAVNTVCELSNVPKLVASNLTVNTVLDQPAYYIEDISIDAEHFEFCRKLIMQIYDGNSPIQNLIVTLNPEIADSFMPNAEMKFAFWRRMHNFKFSFAVKEWKIFTKDVFYTPQDLEFGAIPHSKCVNITDMTLSTPKNPLFYECIQLVEFLSAEMLKVDMNAYKNVITRSVPYISKEDVQAQFHVKFGDTANELFQACYEDPTKLVSWILSGKAKLITGGIQQGMQIAQQFAGPVNARPKYPGNLEDFIILINNSQFTSKISFTVIIECKDQSIVIMPKKNDPFTIRCFKLCDKLKINRNSIEDSDETCESTELIFKEYTEHMETVQEIAAQLPQKVDEVVEDGNNTTGFLSIFCKFPSLKKVCKIFLFMFKMYLAGHSIMTLLSISKERFLGPNMQFFMEAKGKNKRGIRAKNIHKQVKDSVLKEFGSSGYDNIRSFVDQYGTTAAKNAKVEDLLTAYYMAGDRSNDNWYDMLDFMESVDQEELDLLNESREFIVKPKPSLEPIPDLVLEKKQDIKKFYEDSLNEQGEQTVFLNESLVDPGCVSTATKVCKNVVEIGYVRETGFSRCVYGLMLAGNIGVTVQHFITKPTFWMRDPKRDKSKTFEVEILVRVVDKDYCFFKINDPQCALYTNIVNLFPKNEKSMKTDYSHKNAILVTTEFKNGMINNIFRNIKLHTTQQVRIVDDGTTRDVFTYSGFASGVDYAMPIMTQDGDCGSFIVVNDTSVEKKVLGIHNSADELRGGCTLLFQNLIDIYVKPIRFKSQSNCINSVSPQHHKIEYSKVANEALLGMPVVATIEEVSHQINTTKFWDSPLALCAPDENPFAPSILAEFDPRNQSEKHPFYNSIEKWNHKQPEIDRDEVFAIAEDIGEMYADVIHQHGIKTAILTKTEAINASLWYEIKGLNRDASPGYPWRKIGKKVGSFIDSVNDNGKIYFKLNEFSKQCLLDKSIDNLIAICSSGFNYPSIAFAGALKDEPIKKQKIFDVNTRSFAGAPLDYTITSRMYFASIQGAIHAVRRVMPIQIGIDPTSLEWNTMMKRLLTVSDQGTDADFKNWDGSIPSVLLESVSIVYNIIAQRTNPNWEYKHDVIRNAMCASLKKPNLIVPLNGKTYIVQAPGGMPSGSPRTADDNSIIHLILLRMAWDKICIKNNYAEFANQTTFMQNVQAMIYGDDGGYAISPKVLHFFNFSSICDFFKSINMVCTPASKDDKILDFKPVLELEFLKRNTVKIGPHYYGALQQKTFNKMLGYCLGKQHHYFRDIGRFDYKEADLIQTAHSCLLESLYHGQGFYNKMRNHLMKVFDRLDIKELLPRFKDLALQRSLPILQ